MEDGSGAVLDPVALADLPSRVGTRSRGRFSRTLGAKRQRSKSGGAMNRIGGPQLAPGSGGGPARGRAIADRRPPITPGPITPAGVRMVEEFLRRSAFLDAIGWGMTVARAGKLFLGDIGRRRAEVIHRETGDTAELLAWFRTRAMDAIRDGRIRPGRATTKSPEADVFFAVLWGEPGDGPRQLIDRGETDLHGAIDLDKIARGLEPWDAEAIDYHVYS